MPIAVALAPTPLVDDRYMKQQIRFLDPVTGEIAGTVEHAGKLGSMEWSPDGGHLAFIAGVDTHDPADGSLFVVGMAGGQPRNLTTDLGVTVIGIDWQNAETVVFLAAVGVRSEVFQARVGGGPLSVLGLKAHRAYSQGSMPPPTVRASPWWAARRHTRPRHGPYHLTVRALFA